jgi:hypothetical protein
MTPHPGCVHHYHHWLWTRRPAHQGRRVLGPGLQGRRGQRQAAAGSRCTCNTRAHKHTRRVQSRAHVWHSVRAAWTGTAWDRGASSAAKPPGTPAATTGATRNCCKHNQQLHPTKGGGQKHTTRQQHQGTTAQDGAPPRGRGAGKSVSKLEEEEEEEEKSVGPSTRPVHGTQVTTPTSCPHKGAWAQRAQADARTRAAGAVRLDRFEGGH